MLISEYVGDAIMIKEERAVRSRKEALWKLVAELLDAFSQSDPTKHVLFKNAKEMNDSGFRMLFTCYDAGVPRLQALLRQDILKTETCCVKGRRAKNIVSHKLENLMGERSVKRKRVYPFATEEVEERVVIRKTEASPEIITRMRQQQRRATNERAKNILRSILADHPFPRTRVPYILQQLRDEGEEWTEKRIQIYWKNHNYRKKNAHQSSSDSTLV